MKRWALLLAFLLFIHCVIASNVELTLIDASTNTQIDSIITTLILNNSFKTNNYVEKTMQLYLPEGYYLASLAVEDLNTPGKDYFINTDLTIKGQTNETIYLTPAGTINGIVKNTDGTLIKDANLKFNCPENFQALPETTDSFGSFSVKYIGIGNCRIFAEFNGVIGYTDVSVKKGQIVKAEISADYNTGSSPLIWIITILIIVSVFYLIIIRGKLRHDRQIAEHPKLEISEQHYPNRINDILTTLNQKEKAVVTFLLEHKAESSHANIRHQTGIPRTSLSRILTNLEQKNIILTEKKFNTFHVKLTDWFLAGHDLDA